MVTSSVQQNRATTSSSSTNEGDLPLPLPGLSDDGFGIPPPSFALPGGTAGNTAGTSGGGTVVQIITPPPTSAGGGLVINFNFDSSVTSSPYSANIVAAAEAAASYFETIFSNPVTITINLGYGEINGSPISPTAAAQSLSNPGSFSYSQVKSALQANAQTLIDQVAVNLLPASDPTSSGTHFDVTPAEEKALGLGSPGGVDGEMGLSSATNFDIYNPNWSVSSRALGGTTDAIGAIEHELSEIMGRVGRLGGSNHAYTPLDLFRYSGPGTRALSPGPGYFSVNGVTMLTPYNDATTGPDAGADNSDWSATFLYDAFGDAFASRTLAITPTDIAEMNVLGWQPYNQIVDVPVPTITAGQTLSGARVTSGGDLNVESGGSATEITLSAGLSTYTRGITASGSGFVYTPVTTTTDSSTVSMTVQSGGHATYTTLSSGGRLGVGAGADVTHTFVYGGGIETVIGGTTLDSSGVIPIYAVATVTDGTHTARLAILGSYVFGNFHLADDGHGGTRITDPPVDSSTLAPPH